MNKEKIIFIDHIADSFNSFVNITKHGYKKQLKDRYKRFAENAIKNLEPVKKGSIIEIEWIPVINKFENHSRKKRDYDVLNYCHQYKYSEDTLTKNKIIVDDSSKYVCRHILNSAIYDDKLQHRGIIMIIRIVDSNNTEHKQKYLDIVKEKYNLRSIE